MNLKPLIHAKNLNFISYYLGGNPDFLSDIETTASSSYINTSRSFHTVLRETYCCKLLGTNAQYEKQCRVIRFFLTIVKVLAITCIRKLSRGKARAQKHFFQHQSVCIRYTTLLLILAKLKLFNFWFTKVFPFATWSSCFLNSRKWFKENNNH